MPLKPEPQSEPRLRTTRDIRRQTESARQKLIRRVSTAYGRNRIPWTEEVEFYCNRLSLVELSGLALHWEGRAFEAEEDARLRVAAGLPPETDDEDDAPERIAFGDHGRLTRPLFGGPNPNIARMYRQRAVFMGEAWGGHLYDN